jgi:heptosyltransferase-2
MYDQGSHIIVQTGFIGDIALTFHLIEELRLAKPHDRIILLTTPTGAEIAQAFPRLVNEVIVFDKRGKHRGLKGLKHIIETIREVRAGSIISLHQSFRTGLMIALSKIPIRIGYKTASLSFFLTDHYPYRFGVHEIERQRELLRGLDPQKLPMKYIPRRSVLGRNAIHHSHAFQEPIIVIAPGSVWETKKWPAAYFTELIQFLLNNTSHLITLIGSSQDAALCTSIIPSNHQGRVLNLAGTMSLQETISHLKQSILLIGNDSAPIHLASLVNCPTIAIFGPTHPAFGFSPSSDYSIIMQKDFECRPCSIHGQSSCPLGTHACMKSITPKEIGDQVLKYLSHDA